LQPGEAGFALFYQLVQQGIDVARRVATCEQARGRVDGPDEGPILGDNASHALDDDAGLGVYEVRDDVLYRPALIEGT
jgi:hypothetical protein